MSESVTFIHLTDLHIGNPAVPDDHQRSDTTNTLRAILTETKTLVKQPKFIVASGDRPRLQLVWHSGRGRHRPARRNRRDLAA